MVVRLPAAAAQGVAGGLQRAAGVRADVRVAAEAGEQEVHRADGRRVRVSAGLAVGAEIRRGQRW